jgi:hypothetical protein
MYAYFAFEILFINKQKPGQRFLASPGRIDHPVEELYRAQKPLAPAGLGWGKSLRGSFSSLVAAL